MTEPKTMYLLMRLVYWKTAEMITNLNSPVRVARPADAPECIGFCLVFATREAAVEAAADGDTIQPIRAVSP